METNQAAENLQVIRTLMERSALYRRALAPIMMFNGAVGIVGGVTGWQSQIESDRGFIFLWFGVAAVSLIGSFLLVRRQALKDHEPFWSPPTKRVAYAMVPPLVIGAFVGGLISIPDEPGSRVVQVFLALAWTCLYGCAIHSAGSFMPRGFRVFGWGYVTLGCLLIFILHGLIGLERIEPHTLMGALFGGLHLGYGTYLYFTEQRKNVA